MAERQPDATRVPASVPRSDGVLVAVADLQVTHEELRVAEEELAEQREQLGELVARHDSGQRWRDHLFALLPVGVLVTDGEGKVLEANARAAGLLGVRLVHLPGTPLLVYVQTAHRRLVRELLAQFGQGQRELRATVTVTPRQGQRFPADLIALPDAEGAPGTLRWVILPEVDRAGTASFPPTSNGCSAGSRWWSARPCPAQPRSA